MTTNVSKQERTVKRIPAHLNPRPCHEESATSFADVFALLRSEPDDPLADLNPRPSIDDDFDFAILTAPARKAKCHNGASKQAKPKPQKAKKPRKKYPVGIGRLQGWLGVRSGVSPKLRRLCDSGDEALIMNQLVCYWFARGPDNRIRARIPKARHRWVAKSHREWAEELGMTPLQVRRCVAALEKKGFIEVRTWRFNGANTTHIRPLTGPIAVASGCPDDQESYRKESRVVTEYVNETTFERLQLRGQRPFRAR